MAVASQKREKIEIGLQFRNQWTWKFGYSPNSGKQNFPVCFFEILSFFWILFANFDEFWALAVFMAMQPGQGPKKRKKFEKVI